MKYQPRIIDQRINDLMEISGGILIEGCKWCGKTTTAKEHAKSYLEFQDSDRQEEFRQIANTRPSLFLEGEKPRLFDEWQRFPVVWDAVRVDTDRTGKTGQYLLTGSARPAEGVTMHTGTGRINRVVMRPMSLFEQGFSDGKVSLKALARGENITALNEMRLEDLANYIVWGGWPLVPSTKKSLRPLISEEYFNSIIHEEVRALEGTERNYDKMRGVIRSISRNLSTPVNLTTLEKDTEALFLQDVSRATVRDYLNTLKKLFVVYDVPATTFSFRSKSAIRTTPKRELVDPSVGTAALGIGPDDLMKDLRTFGFMFECLAFRDLIVYSGGTGENIYYYRNADGFEVDAIIHLANGKWGAVEVKLGDGQVDETAKNLLKLREMLDPAKGEDLAFLMVLTATNFSYRRDDGVYVVSIGSLRD